MKLNLRRSLRRALRLRPSRKYRIKRDEHGHSIRQRAFALFRDRKGPSEVAKILHASLRTIYRYRSDWRRQPNQFRYSELKAHMRRDPQLSESVKSMLMRNLGMSGQEVDDRLGRPWGLMQALRGQWPNLRFERAQDDVEARLEGAVRLFRFAESFGNDPKKLGKVLKDLIRRAGKEPATGTDKEGEQGDPTKADAV